MDRFGESYKGKTKEYCTIQMYESMEIVNMNVGGKAHA